ncbi:hypothetical protein Tco_0711438 [Tanacetum coccineum]
MRLQALQEEEAARQVHLDALLAKRISKKGELSEQQNKRKAEVQKVAQFYTEWNWITSEQHLKQIQTGPRVYKEKKDLEGDDLLLYDAEMELMNMILLSIPNEIYNSVDACTSAKDMGIATCFSLQLLQLEWLKYVTQVCLAKRLTVDSFDDLFDYLQQYEKLVNTSRAKNGEKGKFMLGIVKAKDKILNAELEKVKKKSFEIQEDLQARIKILEKDVQRCEKQSVDFQLKLQHEKKNQKIGLIPFRKNKSKFLLITLGFPKMEKLEAMRKRLSLDFKCNFDKE